ncbi:rho GTPase-activating protein 20-like isoform X3 [Strix uralensis]|uniref:rho GTPase-activating protein 20-like isoform X3 n=1 Tax=Strix uralensis TaxID=36305 RepID=UPI003DA73AD3
MLRSSKTFFVLKPKASRVSRTSRRLPLSRTDRPPPSRLPSRAEPSPAQRSPAQPCPRLPRVFPGGAARAAAGRRRSLSAGLPAADASLRGRAGARCGPHCPPQPRPREGRAAKLPPPAPGALRGSEAPLRPAPPQPPPPPAPPWGPPGGGSLARPLRGSSRSGDALANAEPVLSADVQLTWGCKRSERRLFLLQEELVVTKLRGGTILRPQLRLALDQLWVLSDGKEAAWEEEVEGVGSHEERSSLIFLWPRGSCTATFGSQALKELWVRTLLGTPDGAKKPRVTLVPSLKLLEKELSRRHAWRPFSTSSLERLVEGQAEVRTAAFPLWLCWGAGMGVQWAGGIISSSRRRRRGLPWPFALRRSLAAAPAPGQAGSGCSRPLFGQPLAALCGEDGTLPRPIQELLAVLQQEGPSTEGIFRRATGGTELRELREALDCGADVDLGSQPTLLLAAILKDFLRSIPCKLLMTDLYEDWMAAMQKASREEKIWDMRVVAEKLPAANLLLLKRLLSLLQHIGHHAATSRMGCSNLAVCVGPNLLSPAHADLVPLEAMLEVTHKVNVLVEFLVENCGELFEEEVGSLSSPADKELPAPLERFRGTASFASSHPREHGRLPGAPRTTGQISRGKKVCRLCPGRGEEEEPEEKRGLGRGQRKLRRKEEEEERRWFWGRTSAKTPAGAAGRAAQVPIHCHRLNHCDSGAPQLLFIIKRSFLSFDLVCHRIF